MPRTVITGGAGFLGSHLCDRFMEDGHEVVCVDNLITGRRENVAHLGSRAGFSFVEQDVSDHIDIAGPVDFILHFASPASPIDYARLPIQTLKVGSLGTHNALGVARKTGARFLLASTSEVYGDPLKHPQGEDYWGNVNPIGLRGVYDEAKRFGEALTMAYHRSHGMETRIARIFNTFGPRMRVDDGRAVATFLAQGIRREEITVFGDGGQTRSFCYVPDLVEGIVRLLHSDEPGPVNLGNPEEIPVLQLAEEIREITGGTSPITHKALPEDDPKVRRPDIGKARRLLDWEPKVARSDGLRKTYEDFVERLREG